MGAMAVMKFSEKYPELQDVIDRLIIIDMHCIPKKSNSELKNTRSMLA